MNAHPNAARSKAHADYFKARSNGKANHGGVLSNVFTDGFDRGAACWEVLARAAGWASPEEVQKLREALIECKRQAASMRIWNGMGWTYQPPQAKKIFDAAEAALAATRTGEQHDNFCT